MDEDLEQPMSPALASWPLTIKACHFRRGSYQSQVTRVGQKVIAMRISGLTKYVSDELDAMNTTIRQQVDPFRRLHEHILTYFDLTEREMGQETAAADTFEDAVDLHTASIRQMKAAEGCFHELTWGLAGIRAAADEAPDDHTLTQIEKYKTSFTAAPRGDMTIISGDPVLSVMFQEIKDALHVLDRRIADAKTAAEALTRPPPVPHEALDRRTSGAAEERPRRETSFTHRLPRIELPVFTGSYLDWHSFWSIFERNVHSNVDLLESEKVAYLRKAIQDESRPNLINTESATPGCYPEYVASLKSRYDQRRRIHSHHAREIFRCPPCKDASASELTRLHTTLSDSIKRLQFTTQFTLETVLTSFCESLLPPELWEAWNLKEGDPQVVPDIFKLLEFLERRSNLAQLKVSDLGNRHRDGPIERPRPPKRPTSRPEDSNVPRRQNYAARESRQCALCQEEQHALFHCERFKAMTVDERGEYVRHMKLCVNCLSHGHSTRDCHSMYRCRRCKKAHHSILHRETSSEMRDDPRSSEERDEQVTAAVVVNRKVGSPGVFIPTARLTAHAPDGQSTEVRAMLDNGSTISLIKASVVRRLHLRIHRVAINIVGVQGTDTGHSNSLVRFVLRSKQRPSISLDLTAYVVDTVAGDLPDQAAKRDLEFLNNLTLADPTFHVPGGVDLLLGNDVLDDVVQEGTRRGKQEYPRATNTIFGWVVEGRMSQRELPNNPTSGRNGYCAHITKRSTAEELIIAQHETTALLKTFWEVEAVPQTQSLLTPEETAAVEHFDRTHQINADGRFEVMLPRKASTDPLGNSRGRAMKRFLSNEASLLRRKTWEPFQAVIEEYFALGHAEAVPTTEIDAAAYYMPMHAVIKESSTTTKLRVVFDASAATTTGVSFNDLLATGPTVQQTLYDILLRFRTHRVGVSADVSKMYRAIQLAPAERDFHRFLWRRHPTDQVTDQRMRRVTFGVAASPFVATKVLQQIATNARSQFPEAAHQISDSFYVDDFLSGAATHEEATTVCRQISDLLGQHGLELRKWRSNSPGFLGTIPKELVEASESVTYGPEDHQKTLGVHWDATADHFFVSTSQLRLPATLTKRKLAADIHSTFDVMGWLTPVTLRMKILLQGLWEEGLDWDEEVPAKTQEDWSSWRRELPHLAAIPIPRHYYLKEADPCSLQLHGFSDASMMAYAATIYVRAEYRDHSPTVTLVTSKSRVSPLKPLTVPRLELCGAHLLAQLMTTVRQALGIDLQQVTCWTDSTIVLNWLDGSARRYKTYVANRIVNTLDLVPAGRWMHVPTGSNPADCASRGIQPLELVQHPLWWRGPSWLQEDPIRTPPQPGTTLEPTERKLAAHTQEEPRPWLAERFSTFQRLRRVTGWILRFVRQSRPTLSEATLPTLTSLEIEAAERWLYRQSQKRSFGHGPGRGKDSTELRALHPFQDDEQLIRVGGRLENANMGFSKTHPIILHSRDRLTTLMIRHFHLTTGHAGPNLLLARLSEEYHLIRAMKQVKAICRDCVRCRRLQAKATSQLMGQLPAHRVRPDTPFNIVGVDYAGPILIKYAHVRKPVVVKSYICVYICMTTRAIHLEVVSDLSTEAFLACLDRFTARRGRPRHIYSDNGGNFVGAARRLEDALISTQKAQDTVADHCTTRGTTWHFSPERAPHFGGIWEAGVKAMKFHLRRILGETKTTYEELCTITCRIEAMLNSRPLVRLYSHSEEGLETLTPGHFLIGRPLEALPSRTPPATTSLTRRWNLCQELTKHFWERWSKEYLRQLQARSRWTRVQPNLKVDDLVLMKDSGPFHQEWPLARVVRTFPGKDGLVRVVLLRAKGSSYKRPVAGLTMVLPSDETDSSQTVKNGDHPVLAGGMFGPQEAEEADGDHAHSDDA